MRQAYSSRSSIAMALKKAKPRTAVRGFQTCLLDQLLGRLLATLLLLATLPWLRLATLLLLTTLLLTRLLVRILIHRSFLSNIGLPLRSLVFHGESQSMADAFVPLMKCVWNLSQTVEFPLQGEPTMGRYLLLW